jgi:plasmid stability protein
MVALQIRHVPDDVRQSLADRAAAQGQSLQTFLLALVTDEARRSANLALLEMFTGRHDGSRMSVAEVVDELDQARDEREKDPARRAADT